MIQKGSLEFGDIAWVNFDPSVGHEFQKKRPAIIIQSKEQLQKSNLVTIIPLTSNISNCEEDDILISVDGENHLKNDSVVKVYYITSFDSSRFIKKIGKINADKAFLIKLYLKKHFGL